MMEEVSAFPHRCWRGFAKPSIAGGLFLFVGPSFLEAAMGETSLGLHRGPNILLSNCPLVCLYYSAS